MEKQELDMGSGDEAYDRKYQRRRKVGKIVSIAVSLIFLGAMAYSYLAKALH